MTDYANNNDRSLILRPDVSLASVTPGPKRILSSMVAETFALALQEPITAEIAEEFFENGNDCFNGDRGTPEDEREAVSWYLKAARLGHAHAQYFLGQCYDEALGGEKDNIQVVYWWSKAAEQGHHMAQYDLGWKHRYGIDMPVDTIEAYKWFKLAADQGHQEAQMQVNELAPILEGEGLIESQVAPPLETDAVLAHVDLDALVREGKRIQRKEGMTPEDVKAFGLFFRAAEGGHSEAQYLVFRCYFWGFGIPHSLPKGIEWLRKSAEAGFAEAQDSLGFCYSHPSGVPQDYAEAARWYRKAAEQGNSNAQRAHGFLYASGQGVQQDYAEAVRWYRKAAEQGNACAQTNLGECYANGQGAEIDLPRAYAWYQLAADQGYEFVHNRPTELKGLMSPWEFDGASQFYQEFKEKYSKKK